MNFIKVNHVTDATAMMFSMAKKGVSNDVYVKVVSQGLSAISNSLKEESYLLAKSLPASAVVRHLKLRHPETGSYVADALTIVIDDKTIIRGVFILSNSEVGTEFDDKLVAFIERECTSTINGTQINERAGKYELF